MSPAVGAFIHEALRIVPFIEYLRSPVAIALQILAIITYMSVRFMHISPHEMVLYVWKFITFSFRRLGGGRVFLLVTDADETGSVAATMAQRLQKHLTAEGFRRPRVVWLSDGDQLLQYPMLPFLVGGAIVLITDVTSLSNDPVRRKIIQKKMEWFTQCGGCLVVSHDALYRRAKNDILQSLAGGAISRFQAVTGDVEYQKLSDGLRASANRPLLEQLPPAMALQDNEVVSGEWLPGVEYLYVWRDETSVPLVTRRVVGRGVVFWCNTGDRNMQGPPPAIVRSDSAFIPLLSKLIALR